MDFQLNLNTDSVTEAEPEQAIVVEPTKSARDVLLLLKSVLGGCVLIAEDGQLTGIFTEKDALKLMAGEADLQQPISEFMISQPETLMESDSVGLAIAKMATGGYRRMPMLDDESQPAGVVSVAGILHHIVQHFPSTVYNLPPNPHHNTEEREGA